MAITLSQVNTLLAERGKPAVTTENLFDALDYARGFYKVRPSALTAETPAEQLVLAIALLASQAPFTQAASTQITSKEIKGNAGGIKTDYAEAPVDPYPVIGGLLAPFAVQVGTGVSFGVSSR